ncbi:MAG: FecR domain-containing protein [Bdellovibrionaceae bacterium]|nr:FecR domain-containing protein [Pseudobdellovibrionaceae bacterium]
MGNLLFVLVSLLLPMTFAPAVAAADVSCECPTSSCGVCEAETGVTFYSEKCGPGGSRVRSCKRPTCVAVPEQKICLAKHQQSLQDATREPASARGERAGEVILAVGKVSVRRAEEQGEKPLTTGMQLIRGDEIVTGADGRVRVRFPELSEIFVNPNTNLRIDEATGTASEPKRRVLMQLMKGKVRSRVTGRYDSSESRFEVRTKAAVAGVRGTDFVTSFEPGPTQWTTEVRTLSGEVGLKGIHPSSGKANVTAMTFAAYVVPAPSPGASAEEIDEALSRGYTSPVLKMGEEDQRELDRDILAPLGAATVSAVPADSVAVAARLPSADSEAEASALCHGPRGDFNQCAWSCEGNPKGEKKCRTDLKGVACVRRLCRANGQWAEPTILTPLQGSKCEAEKSVVSDCGSYW